MLEITCCYIVVCSSLFGLMHLTAKNKEIQRCRQILYKIIENKNNIKLENQ